MIARLDTNATGIKFLAWRKLHPKIELLFCNDSSTGYESHWANPKTVSETPMQLNFKGKYTTSIEAHSMDRKNKMVNAIHNVKY